MMLKKYTIGDVDIQKYPVIKDFFEEVKDILHLTIDKNYANVYIIIDKSRSKVAELKKEAIINKDEKTANISFLMNTYLNLLYAIAKFWEICKTKDYQSAWSFLQDGIDSVRTLTRFMENDTYLLVKSIGKYLDNLEKLYPYVYFNSIEAINKVKTCSICNNSPFSSKCNHIAGDLYMGEMAHVKVELTDLLGTSFVKNPMDKRCIIFMDCNVDNIENTPFKHVHTLITSLDKPYHFFDLKLTKRKLSRSYYEAWKVDSECPCGSDKQFKDCCASKDFIENPHYIIESKGVLKF